MLNKEREAKAAWERNKARRLKAVFQRAAKKYKETYLKQSFMKLEEDCRKGHTRDLFVQVRKI